MIGKADDVGTTPGWTVSDMKALLASKPEGTQLFWGMDRTSALTALMSLGYNDFINWEDASCNFDSQEFIDVLDLQICSRKSLNIEMIWKTARFC